MKLETRNTKLETFSALIDDRLRAIIDAEDAVENLHDGMLYSLGLDLDDRVARGKRVRPVLCLLTAEALGTEPELALPFACAIELMHNFALVHDDIEDGDLVRRNRPTVWQKYGLAHGVNIGDYLHCKVYSTLLDRRWQITDHVRLELVRLMSETLDHTHIGQSLDISARSVRDFGLADYYQLAREKTAYYLAAPMLGGAIVAGADKSILDALHTFGHAIGPMFQITDDLLDLTTGKGRGGAIGSDIREGKRSFLVAHLHLTAPDADRRLLDTILDKPRETTTDADVKEVLGMFERHGSLKAARERCDELLAQGLAALQNVPERLREVLTEAAREMAKRER